MALYVDKASFECVTTRDELSQWITACTKAGEFAFDTETTGLDVFKDELVGISLAVQIGDKIEACYIPVAHKSKERQLARHVVVTALRPLLESKKIKKVFQNAAYDLAIMRRYDVRIENIDDTMLMSYCLSMASDMRGHGMDHLAMKYLKHRTIQFDDVVVKELGMETFADVSLPVATAYAAEDSAVTLLLARVLKAYLAKAKIWGVYTEIDAPLVPVLDRMFEHGANVNVHQLRKLATKWKQRLAQIEDDIYELAGEKFELNSPKQLGNILYDKLGLECFVFTDSGARGTGKEALELLDHQIVEAILEYRGLTKLVTTYCEGLETKIEPATGKVHTSFTITITKTGRLSSRNPNLQNIPTRTKEGKEIREAFIAGTDRLLAICDYSQIEYRIAAHVSGDPTMLKAYADGIDFHDLTAADIAGQPIDWVSTDEGKPVRRIAKTVNFLTLYGGGPGALAYQAKIELDAAYEFMDRHRKTFDRFYEWKEELWEAARRDGYVWTPFGRRIPLPGIRSKDRGVRGHSERLAVSGAIQGGAGDLIRVAMTAVDKALASKPLWGARQFITCHDELVVDVKSKYAEQCGALVKSTMETCSTNLVAWRVPIEAGCDIGKSWADKG